MFMLKKLLGDFFSPLPICFLVVAIGLILDWGGWRKRLGRMLVVAGILWLLLTSGGPLPRWAIWQLEKEESPMSLPVPGVTLVHVLGSGHSSREDFPASVRLGEEGLKRLTEGVRVWRMCPGAKMLLTGYGGADATGNAEIMRRVAISLGVDEKAIVWDSSPRDTREELSRCRQELAGGGRVLVVSSASHLPRARLLCRSLGIDASYSAAYFHAAEGPWPSNWRHLLPGSGALRCSERAMYEGAGLVWAWLRD
ncbi:MAG: hypothetical protein RL095_2243 [Verrucomicrobiota bacterium]|jgi:uncharacterized SAM-binding protein YcdF (DUF218 family)